MLDPLSQFPKYEEYDVSEHAWMDERPAHWKIKRLKFVTKITKRIAGNEGPKVLSITQKGIKVKDVDSGEGQLAQDYSKYQIVNKGDFAMNHMDLLTGYVDISKYNGVVSPDYRVFVNASKDVDDKYLLWLFQMGYRQRIFYRFGSGVSFFGRWRLPAEAFNNFEIPIPSLGEQQSIINFLGEKTQKIDRAIAIKEAQIERLEERKQILIQTAVTRGLDHNVEMKDSGIDWIGEIPSHWEVKKFKYLFKSAMGETILSENLIDDGLIPVYSATEEDKFFGYVNYSNISLQKGDLVIPARGNSIGYAKLVKQRSTCSQTTIYAKKTGEISSEFVLNYLIGCKPRLFQFVQTAIPQITVREVSENPLLLPPLNEQCRISIHLDAIKQKYRILNDRTRKQIHNLQEYRASLINAAVTGKIKVPS